MKRDDPARFGFILLLLALFFASYSTVAAEPVPVHVMVQGRVTDFEGRPLAGAFISISDGNYRALGYTHSGVDGYYQLIVAESDLHYVWAGKTERNLYVYIPETKVAQNMTADFRLKPGGNFIFTAYDTSGKRLDNGAMLLASGRRMYLVDMADDAAPGSFAAVHHETSDWQWERAWPAAVVLPGGLYKILLEWELPQVGKLLFTLDNAGRGYRVERAGDRVELNVNREIARSSLAVLQRKPAAGNAAAAIQEASAHMAAGEAAMASTPPDMVRAVREFSLSVESSLEAHELLVMARAAVDIEKNRKGDVALTIVDENGVALSGISIGYRQTSNDFMFGAHPLGRNGAYDERLAGLMREAGINGSYITARWGLLEEREGQFNWDNIENYQQPQQQQRAGFGLLGALSLWLTPHNDFSPLFLRMAPFPQLRDAVYRYAYSLAQRYAGTIDVWEVNELNLDEANAFHLTWDQRVEIGQTFARAIRAGNPNAKIMYGSLALPYDAPSSRTLFDLLRAGLPADIVGIELYQAGVNRDGVGVVGLDLVMIDRLLDQYAEFGKPIVVKEFSVPSVQVVGSSWWHRGWDESLQAEFVAKVYTIAFSKPLVRGITWSWGVSDADAFIRHGGLLDENMHPKKSYFALKGLLASWRTHGEKVTNSEGHVAWRGFGGTYQVTVTRQGRKIADRTIRVVEQQSSQLTIHIAGEKVAPEVSK